MQARNVIRHRALRRIFNVQTWQHAPAAVNLWKLSTSSFHTSGALLARNETISLSDNKKPSDTAAEHVSTNHSGSNGAKSIRDRDVFQSSRHNQSSPAAVAREAAMRKHLTSGRWKKGQNIDDTTIKERYAVVEEGAEKRPPREVQTAIEDMVRAHDKKPHVSMYIMLILANANAEHGSAAEVAALLEEVSEMSIPKTASLYSAVLKALAIHPDTLLRGQVLEEMRERWFNLSQMDWHYLVAGYLREGQLEIGLEKLEEMQRLGIDVQQWLYDLAILVLVDHAELDEALVLARELFESKPKLLQPVIWYTLLDAACQSLHIDLLRFIWFNRVAIGKLNPAVGECEQILSAASRNGDVDLAVEIFRFLRKRSVKLESQHYELLVETYAVNGDLDATMRISCIMSDAGSVLDSKSLWPLKHHFLTSISEAKQAMERLQHICKERPIPTDLANLLIESCVDLRRLDEAMLIRGQIPAVCANGVNVNTFNTLLRGCYLEKRKDDAVALVAEMTELEVRPDATTYDHLVQVCLAVGDLKAALNYHSEIQKLEFVLSKKTFINLILHLAIYGDQRADGLLHSGELTDQEQIIVGRRMREVWNSGDENNATW